MTVFVDFVIFLRKASVKNIISIISFCTSTNKAQQKKKTKTKQKQEKKKNKQMPHK